MKNATIQLRISQEKKDKIIEKAEKFGFSNVSEYLIFVGLNAEIEVEAIEINQSIVWHGYGTPRHNTKTKQ